MTKETPIQAPTISYKVIVVGLPFFTILAFNMENILAQNAQDKP